MYKVQILNIPDLIIANCPVNGIPAADWRAAHGLPADPCNYYYISGITITDETLCRALVADYPHAATEWGDWRISMTLPPLNPHHRCSDTWKATVSVNDIPRLVERDPGAIRRLIDAHATALAERCAEIEAANAAVEAEKAAIEQAHQLLAGDLERGAKAETDLSILAQFLGTIPQCVLYDALHKAADKACSNAYEDLRARIENASPVTIFRGHDEDDDDDS